MDKKLLALPPQWVYNKHMNSLLNCLQAIFCGDKANKILYLIETLSLQSLTAFSQKLVVGLFSFSINYSTPIAPLTQAFFIGKKPFPPWAPPFFICYP